MVSKCKVPIVTVLIWTNMVPFLHFWSIWNEGYRNSSKLYCNFACMYFFPPWGKGPGISSELIRFVTKRSLRAINLFSDQMHLFWGGNSQYGFQSKCVSRAIIYKGLWLLVSDSPKYQGVRKEFLNSLYVPSSLFLHPKILFGRVFYFVLFHYLKARGFAHIVTWFHIMRKFGVHKYN